MSDTYRLFSDISASEGPAFEFKFLTMDPMPPRAYERATYQTHSGVDGYSVFKDGNRGDFFQVITVRNCDNPFDLDVTMAAYQFVTTRTAEIEWKSLNFGLVLIDSVVPLLGRRILKIIGGIDDPLNEDKALLIAQWTLLKL